MAAPGITFHVTGRRSVAAEFRAFGALCVLLLAGCGGSRQAEIENEGVPRDDGSACARVHALIGSDEGSVAAELVATADQAVRVASISGKAEACAGELFAWIELALRARPLELRPRLEPRVFALVPYIGSSRFESQARALLESLLSLPEADTRTYLRENYAFLGPGSQKVDTGPRPILSLFELELWSAEALARGHATWTIHPEYTDLLVRYFSRNPEASGAAMLLFPDLLRVFSRAPSDPRFERLPVELRRRLELATAGACPDADGEKR